MSEGYEPGTDEFAAAVKAATERDNATYEEAKQNGAPHGKGLTTTEFVGFLDTIETAGDKDDIINIPKQAGVRDLIARAASPDAPTVFNDKGAGQSDLQHRFDLLDPVAMFALSNELKKGADKYGARNWKNISVEDHVNHALMHFFAYLSGDTTENHLNHAFARAMFALSVSLEN